MKNVITIDIYFVTFIIFKDIEQAADLLELPQLTQLLTKTQNNAPSITDDPSSYICLVSSVCIKFVWENS